MSARLLSPSMPPHQCDRLEHFVPLAQGSRRSRIRDRRCRRRDHDSQAWDTDRSQGLVHRPRVVGPIRRKALDGNVEPLDHLHADRRVGAAALCEPRRYDEPVAINTIDAACARSAACSWSCALRHATRRRPPSSDPSSRSRDGSDRQAWLRTAEPRPTGPGGREWCGPSGPGRGPQSQADQADERGQEALGLPQRKVVHGSQRQRRDDRQVLHTGSSTCADPLEARSLARSTRPRPLRRTRS